MATQNCLLVAHLLDQLNLVSTQVRRVRLSSLPSSAQAVLEALEENGPQSVPQLARGRQTSRQNIQVIVNRLKAQGWVITAANPAHKHSPIVSLTTKATQALGPIAANQEKALEKLGAEFTVEELTNLDAALSKLRLTLPQAFAQKMEQTGVPLAPVASVSWKEPAAEELPVSLL